MRAKRRTRRDDIVAALEAVKAARQYWSRDWLSDAHMELRTAQALLERLL